MYRKVTLLLMCVFTVFASPKHSRTKSYRIDQSSPAIYLQTPESSDSTDSTSRFSSQQFDFLNQLPQLYRMSLPDTDLPLTLNPYNWEPPKYIELLKDFDDATHDIRSHLKYASVDGMDSNSNFIIISHVINGLAVHVAQYGWESYDNKYSNLVKSLVDNTKRDLLGAADDINCILNAANQKILKMRDLINNKWIKFICESKPGTCDSIIHAVLKTSYDEELNDAAYLLLILGKTVSYYQNIYSDFIHESSKKYLLNYLLARKDSLQSMVYKNSLVRRQIFPNGDKCVVQISPYL